ncbi:MAG TPA: VIT domain-containing protein, partial [Kofleriaceae bacterium]|nr:VIT domain-containing protein [Kofleriaceae bacterium]
MNHAVTTMTEDELDRLPRDAEAGFGALATARGQLPLEAMDVRAAVVGLDVRTEVRQTFVNTLGEAIEATYIFPLPDRGAVSAFRLRVGERVIEGVIEERGKARQDYDDALRAGHRAAIAEEERPGTFTLRVGNLMPGEEAVITLELTGPLPVADGEVTYRFPL